MESKSLLKAWMMRKFRRLSHLWRENLTRAMVDLSSASGDRFIISGCHQYENLEDLPSVKNNLTKLVEVLSDPAIGGLEFEACTVVSQPSSPGVLLDAIYDAAVECTGTLLFYFAGHGLTSFQNGDLSLAIPATSPERPYTSVRFDDVRAAVLSARKAPRKVVILDCCFSGKAMVGSMAGPVDLAAHSEIAGTYILTAAAETKTALAPPGEDYTAFTGELLRLLSEGIPGAPEYLSLDLIYANLRDSLTAQSRPRPQQRNRNEGARIALARNMRFSRPGHTGDLDQRVLDHIHAAVESEFDAEEVRRDMRSIHLPYRERVYSAQRLAIHRPQLKGDCVSILEDIFNTTDASGSDRVTALQVLAKIEPTRLPWVCDRLIEVAMGSDSRNFTHLARENACEVLQKLGAQDAAVAGYRVLLADSNVGLGRRVLTAQDMVYYTPQATGDAIEFMWQSLEDAQLSDGERINVLRKICAASPEQIPVASEMIENLLKKIKDAATKKAP
ncbi:caspase family protein [Streptomyces anulatus]|uniref:caspase family protein n=1 Tax=Streptomyces anulatus TaxID=1892 RepID=UPI00225C2F1E|nr:caspase family protein [Streptomyces anulatus]MCX4486312.1 caspase family protein [Streptomyces anulatus]